MGPLIGFHPTSGRYRAPGSPTLRFPKGGASVGLTTHVAAKSQPHLERAVNTLSFRVSGWESFGQVRTTPEQSDPLLRCLFCSARDSPDRMSSSPALRATSSPAVASPPPTRRPRTTLLRWRSCPPDVHQDNCARTRTEWSWPRWPGGRRKFLAWLWRSWRCVRVIHANGPWHLSDYFCSSRRR